MFHSATLELDPVTVPSKLLPLLAFGSRCYCINLLKFRLDPASLFTATTFCPPSAVKHTLLSMIHKIRHVSSSSALSPSLEHPFPKVPQACCAVCVLGLSTGYPHSLKCPLHPLEQTQLPNCCSSFSYFLCSSFLLGQTFDLSSKVSS